MGRPGCGSVDFVVSVRCGFCTVSCASIRLGWNALSREDYLAIVTTSLQHMRRVPGKSRAALKNVQLHVQEFLRVLPEIPHQKAQITGKPRQVVVQFRVVKQLARRRVFSFNLADAAARCTLVSFRFLYSASSTTSLPSVPLPARTSVSSASLFSIASFAFL